MIGTQNHLLKWRPGHNRRAGAGAGAVKGGWLAEESSWGPVHIHMDIKEAAGKKNSHVNSHMGGQRIL